MKSIKLKKGFTIVELVIVVAVIGILAAVLIPTFVNLTNKASQAADKSLVKNLNTSLKMAEEEQGKKNDTFQEAIDDLKAYGYLLPNLVAKSNDKLLYNLDKNEFIVESEKVNGEKWADVDDLDCWSIVDSIPANQKYSMYPGENFPTTVTEIDITVGFDAGERDQFTSITYNRSEATDEGQTAVIRTKGGTLTINAEKDIVKHYGEGVVLDIQAIKGTSYHEYGYFPKASIAQGRIVVEEKGNIPSFEVTSTEPVTIETGKDITVSVSAENADNVSVNITNSSANVALDEKIDDSEVAGNKVTIKKVMTFAELKAAIDANEEYILLGHDIEDHNEFLNINYSVVIDGDNHVVSGNGGIRTGSTYTLFGANAVNARSGIEVEFRNITAINTRTSGIARVLETRAGGIKSFTIKNSHIESKASSNDGNPLVLGSSSTQKLNVLIENSELVTTTTGYAMMIWVPVNMEIVNSTLSGYAGLYFKGGSTGSNTTVRSSTITAPSVHSGNSDNFGAVVFEDGNMTMDIVDTIIDVTGPGKATQTAILFNYPWASSYGVDLENIPVKIYGSKTFINGEINAEYLEYGNNPTFFVEISGGKYSWNPSDYLATGYSCNMVDGLYVVD